MNRRAMSAVIAVAALSAALVLAACGEKSEDGGGELERFDLLLDWHPNPDHAGIYVAQQRGYFDEAGLDVNIVAPTDPAAPIKQVAAGNADLAISYQPEVMLARDQGLDVVAVAAIVDQPLTSMIWTRASGITGIPDLRGKTLVTAGIPYQDAYLRTILARANLSSADLKVVSVGTGLLPALISGQADAILGGFSNIEGIELALRGEGPVVTPVDELGVPTYDELVLVAGGEQVDSDPDAIRLFIAALARGTKAAIAAPEETTAALLEANPDLVPRTTAAEVRATLPLLTPDQGEAFGQMDPKLWETFIGWMRDNELISGLPGTDEVLTNDLLPGKIPD